MGLPNATIDREIAIFTYCAVATRYDAHNHSVRDAVAVVMIMQCVKEDISVMLMWYASAVKGYDRKRPELSDVPLHIKEGTSRTEP